MISLKQTKIKYILFISIVCFISIFLLNSITWYTSDDYAYHFFYQGSFPSEKTRGIQNLFDLFKSQYNHYQIWNGRFIAHTLVQIFMQFNKIFFNIFNSLAFISLGLTINLIISSLNKTKISPSSYLLTFIFIWFFVPEFGNTVLWVSGSGNYLWMSVICCNYILFFIVNLQNKTTISLLVGSSIFGFICGATNENSGLATLGICFLFLIFNYLETKVFFVWQWISLLSGIVGSFLLISSPGAKKRSTIILNPLKIGESIVKVKEMYLNYQLILLVILLVLFVIVLIIGKITKNDILFCSFFMLGGFAAAYALIFSEEYPPRTLFATVIFTIISIIYLYNIIIHHMTNNILNVVINGTILFFALFMFLNSYLYQYNLISETYTTVMEGVHSIEKHKKEDSKDNIAIPIPKNTNSAYDSYSTTNHLQVNADAWFNQWMAKYYNVNSIVEKIN